ncbi:MAG: porin family protein [Saprospiraceae bacterium]|nr:porin family protein [Saprospiraceae bacterium]
MRNLILLAAALMTAHISTAQWSMGPKVEYSVTNVTVDGVADLAPDPEFMNNYSLGVYANYDFGQGFSIQPELLFKQKGFVIREDFPVNIFEFEIPVGVEARTRIKYLELPVMARYSFGEKIKGYIEGGPALGYAVDADIKERAHLLVDINIGEQDIDLQNDLYNRWEASGIVGAGMSIPAGQVTFDLGVRYQHSITDLLDDPIIDIRLRNYGVSFGAGVKYKF